MALKSECSQEAQNLSVEISDIQDDLDIAIKEVQSAVVDLVRQEDRLRDAVSRLETLEGDIGNIEGTKE